MTGAECRKRRRALGLTQAELAELAGLSRCTVIDYELGHPSSRQSTARVLELSLDGLERGQA